MMKKWQVIGKRKRNPIKSNKEMQEETSYLK